MRTRFQRRMLAGVVVAAAAATLTGVGPAAATNEFPAYVSVGDVRFYEGTGSGWPTLASFPVTVWNNADTTTVNWKTLDGTGCSNGFCFGNAFAPGDYKATSGSLTFTGDGTKHAWVWVTEDAANELNEHFRVKLTSATGFTVIDDDTGVATIMDDDGPPKLNILDVTMTEGTGGGYNQAVLSLSLSKKVASQVKVNFDIVDSTATASSGDYLDATGTITIDPNTSGTKMWVLIHRDSKCEGNETLKVVLSNPTSGVVIADPVGQVTITDDDWFC